MFEKKIYEHHASNKNHLIFFQADTRTYNRTNEISQKSEPEFQ